MLSALTRWRPKKRFNITYSPLRVILRTASRPRGYLSVASVIILAVMLYSISTIGYWEIDAGLVVSAE